MNQFRGESHQIRLVGKLYFGIIERNTTKEIFCFIFCERYYVFSRLGSVPYLYLSKMGPCNLSRIAQSLYPYLDALKGIRKHKKAIFYAEDFPFATNQARLLEIKEYLLIKQFKVQSGESFYFVLYYLKITATESTKKVFFLERYFCCIKYYTICEV